MATWVIGDIHGCYDVFMSLLQDENIKPEDRIILVGDIIDRGPDSYKMIKWAMQNISETGRYQMILGNHEDNIIQDYDNCKGLFERGFYNTGWRKVESLKDLSVHDLRCNYDFPEYMENAGLLSVESVTPIVDWFKTLPLYKKVRVKTASGKTQKYIIAHAWYRPDHNRDTLLWYRDLDDWTNHLRDDYKPEGNEILIHGHTPVQLIYRREPDQWERNDIFIREHSINIDCGCVWRKDSGQLAAIRLEDQKVIYY